MKRSDFHRIQGIMVEAGRHDLAKIMAKSMKPSADMLESKDNMPGRGVKKRKNASKLERETAKRQASKSHEKAAKNKRPSGVVKEFSKKQQSPQVTEK